MSKNKLDKKFNDVLKIVALKLKSVGFSGRGFVFRIMQNGNCGIIEFQRSSRSNSDKLLFTVNLGIVCVELMCSQCAQLDKASIVEAHIRQRIGVFLPGRPDKWWEIVSNTEPSGLAGELCELIMNIVVPYILRFLNTTAIILLWKSGQCPGLTDAQRMRLLNRLDSGG